MRQSMTAFARATEENAQWRISVELKSVNHRFLEIQVKMGDTLRHLEGAIRERLQAAVARGKHPGNRFTFARAHGDEIGECGVKEAQYGGIQCVFAVVFAH